MIYAATREKISSAVIWTVIIVNIIKFCERASSRFLTAETTTGTARLSTATEATNKLKRSCHAVKFSARTILFRSANKENSCSDNG